MNYITSTLANEIIKWRKKELQGDDLALFLRQGKSSYSHQCDNFKSNIKITIFIENYIILLKIIIKLRKEIERIQTMLVITLMAMTMLL